MKTKHLSAILLVCILFPSCLNGFRRNDSKNLATGEAIINCLKTKDVDAMYDLFSEQAKQETPFLKEDIKKFYALYEGDITSYKKLGLTADANKEGRDKSFEYFTNYDITINDIEYKLDFVNTTYNSFARETEGVKTIKLIKAEDKDKYFEYFQQMSPGVFLPERYIDKR